MRGLLTLAIGVSTLSAETVLIRNATVLTVTKGTVTSGSVLSGKRKDRGHWQER